MLPTVLDRARDGPFIRLRAERSGDGPPRRPINPLPPHPAQVQAGTTVDASAVDGGERNPTPQRKAPEMKTKSASKTPTLGDSWLVQRLTKPHRTPGVLGDNPFSFGGGLRNGNINKDAMALIRDVFGFDYMGAAEFEWGAVPKALSTIAQSKTLTATSFDIKLSDVAENWRNKGKPALVGAAPVYVLAPAPWVEEIEPRVRQWASVPYAPLKEQTRLPDALRPDPEYPSRVAGWLELDNGFMFFTDRTMWEQTCLLFGVATL